MWWETYLLLVVSVLRIYYLYNRSLSITPSSEDSPFNLLPTNFRTADETQTLRKHCHARLRRFCIQILFCVDSGILSDSRNDLHVKCDLLSCVCKGKSIVFFPRKRRERYHDTDKQTHTHTHSQTDPNVKKDPTKKEKKLETIYRKIKSQ